MQRREQQWHGCPCGCCTSYMRRPLARVYIDNCEPNITRCPGLFLRRALNLFASLTMRCGENCNQKAMRRTQVGKCAFRRTGSRRQYDGEIRYGHSGNERLRIFTDFCF